MILLKDVVYETGNFEYPTNLNKNKEISRNNHENNGDQEKVGTAAENRSNKSSVMGSGGSTNNWKNNLNIIESTEEVVKGARVIPVGCIELPTCTVCLRRLQSSVSGVDGGNDIPVSIRFYGNTSRCQACRIYGDCNESDGSRDNKSKSQVLCSRIFTY